MKAPEGAISVKSPVGVEETTNRMVVFLELHGITVYTRINQQKELLRIGLESFPMEFILFGNPVTGGQVILKNAIAGLDLPLKMLIWEDCHSKTWVTYNDSQYIGKRYGLDQASVKSLDLSMLPASALKL